MAFAVSYYPAKSVSPRSSNAPSGEKRGEADVFAGYQLFTWYKTALQKNMNKSQNQNVFLTF